MKLPQIFRLLLCVIVLMPSAAPAFETDQYNLPTVPLADIGDEVSDYAQQNIEKVFEKLNREIAVHQACLDKNSSKGKCGSADAEKARLVVLRSKETLASEVFKLLGGGIPPFTNAGTFMEKHQFKAQPARYKTSFGKSIFTHFLINYLTISETVKLYGAEFGTDKVAHFFQQGYSYFRIYQRAKAKNLTDAEAVKKAVKFGQKTERTIYGTLISGVYSDADLCANYTGMKFYQNLIGEIVIGGETHLPFAILKNGAWTFNENVDLRQKLLKPFFDAHLNEALNPSVYTKTFGFRASVRATVRKQSCPQWRTQFPNLTAEDYRKQSEKLQLWNGEDYGYTPSRNFITIADTCFSDQSEKVVSSN